MLKYKRQIIIKDTIQYHRQNQIMEVNEIYCIGSNKFGQAGAGKKHHNQTFTAFNKIVFPVFIKQVVCGSHHSGLLTLEGLVYMMGSNINGALGTPTSALNYSYSPILIENLTDVSKISSGFYHMAAISQGKLYTWGKGVDGQLGTGKQVNCNTPTFVESFGHDVQEVSCGLNHTLVKTVNRKCYAFGNGIYGQLGIGSNKNSVFPALVNIDDVTDVAAGQNFSLFLKNSVVYAAGDNSTGQISSQLKKKYAIEPTQLKIGKVTGIRASKFAIAVIEDKKLCIWGLKQQTSPLFINEIQGYIMDVQTGGNLVYCINSEGELYQWKATQGGALSCSLKQSDLKDKAVIGFSVGQSHSIILGDIVGQVDRTQSPLKNLQNLEANDYSESNSIAQSKASTMKINHHSSSNLSENPSISSQHYSRTPSSIMRQPTNFIKCQAKSIIKQDESQKPQPKQNIQVTEFMRDKSATQLNRNPTKSEFEVSECMKKIEQIMEMLAKNNRIEDSASTPGLISRKMTKSYLDKSRKSQNNSNKENRVDRNQKCNRELIMELREKELKISELQEKLSRKDIEIESQRQLIGLLRKINSQHQ